MISRSFSVFIPVMLMRSWAAAAICISILIVLLAGCVDDKDAVSSEGNETVSDANSVKSVKELGPVKFTAEIAPKKARLSDEPRLTLTIEAEEGVTVKKPPFGENMGHFIILDFKAPMPELKENKKIIKQIYTLEPTTTGEFSIYPISLIFVDDRPNGDGKEHTLETEGLTIVIESPLGDDIPTLDDLLPPIGPLNVEKRSKDQWWWIGGGALLILVVITGAFLMKRKKTILTEKKHTPQELAFMEFQRLLDMDLITLDLKLFYVELTGIVRRYIERTKGVTAPELTTEEFLHSISVNETFPPDESSRLKNFLESADLVKFAAFKPEKTEIEESFNRAKVFIGLDNDREKS